tara:strand:- start:1301 stop:2953 length:1653 start_codon:yes stop_codon:yes gene_type:complete
MMSRGGHFTWSEDNILGGIRQDVSESISRYRNLQNVHVSILGALTKDKGIKALTAGVVASGDTVCGVDAQFNNGTQALYVFQDQGSATKAYKYNSGSWAVLQSGGSDVSFNGTVRPSALMFADKMHVFDGHTLRAVDHSGTVTTPGSSDINTSKFGVVYANRLMAFGNASFPSYFYPSDVRDSSVWNADYAIRITNTYGEEIKGAGVLGPFLIVGGRTFTRAYYLGTASPYDWDHDSISDQIGPINFQSFVVASRGTGNGLQNYGFFWSEEGPMMVVQSGNSMPSLVPLHEPIRNLVRGIDYQGLDGLAPEYFSNVEGVWVPEYNEVRFAVTGKGKTENSMLLCLNLDSAIAHSQGAEGAYPMWRIRNNYNLNSNVFPSTTLFSVQVNSSGVPNTSGQRRAFCGRDGLVYEMDAEVTSKDDGTLMPMYIYRDGYDGHRDGIRENTKSLRQLNLRATQEGNFTLKARCAGDGGVSTTEIDIARGLNLWTSDDTTGRWGDGGRWNSGEFVTQRAGVGVLGKKFELEIYDEGAIEAPIQINSWTLMGYAEDRR